MKNSTKRLKDTLENLLSTKVNVDHDCTFVVV